MQKFIIGERGGKTADDHEDGLVVAVLPTIEGNFQYAVDMEGYGALQFLPGRIWSFTPINRGVR